MQSWLDLCHWDHVRSNLCYLRAHDLHLHLIRVALCQPKGNDGLYFQDPALFKAAHCP
jgi:hypothetical protein